MKRKLKFKLIKSHYYIAFFGLIILVFISGAFFSQQYTTTKLYNETLPLINVIEKLEFDIKRSETMLYKWIITGEQKYSIEQKKIWRQLIPSQIAYIVAYAKATSDKKLIEQIKKIQEQLYTLELWEWRVRDVAHSEGDHPLKAFVKNYMEPISANILEISTAISKVGPNMRDTRYKEIAEIHNIRWNFLKSWMALNEYIQGNNQKDLERAAVDLQKVKKAVEELSQSVSRKQIWIKEACEELKLEISRYNYFFDNFIQRKIIGISNVAEKLLKTNIIKQQDLLMSSLNKVITERNYIKDKQIKYIKDSTYVIFLISLVLMVILLFFSYIISIYRANKIIKPIRTLLDATIKLARNELKADVPITTDDELGELTRSFNIMRYKLQVIEKKLRGIIETAVDPIIIINDQGIIDICNSATTDLFGYSREELLNQNITILMPEPHSRNHHKYLENYKKTKVKHVIGKKVNLEGITKANKKIPLQLSVSEIIVEEKQYFAGILRNLTQEKENEDNIRKINEKLNEDNISKSLETKLAKKLQETGSLKELAQQTLKFFNDHFSISYSIFYRVENNKLTKLYVRGLNKRGKRISQASIVRQCCEEREAILVTKIPEESFKATLGLCEIRPITCLVLPVIYRSDLYAILEFYSTEIFTEEQQKLINKIIPILAVNYNITKSNEKLKNQLEIINKKTEQLEASKIEAESANKAKTFFLSSMSHEIRTPLNSVLGYSEIISKDKNLNKKQLQNIHRILDAGKHLLIIISDILDLTKIESGKIELSIESVSIARLLKECTSITFPLLERFNVRLEMEAPEKLHVYADYSRLKQIFINLISNAIKYDSKGKHVTFITKTLPDNKKIMLGIKDEGEGIPPGKIKTLFQPFTRLSSEKTIEGTGIGLVICKQLIEKMGGSISVESTPGHGATFWIKLNISKEPAKEKFFKKEETITVPLKPANQYRVLAAEDNPSNQELLKQQFDSLGYQLKVVPNGVECFEEWKKGGYDIILMDCNMPTYNGYDTTVNIRKAEKGTNTRIPIIAFTADVLKSVIKKCKDCGMDDYISKPAEIAVLEKKLFKWLSHLENKEKIPFVDFSVINKFVGDNVSAEKSLFETFIKVAQEAERDFSKAIDEKDYGTVAGLMHKFQGSAKACGSIPLSKICANIELLAKEKSDWKNIKKQHKELNALLHRLLQTIKRHLNS